MAEIDSRSSRTRRRRRSRSTSGRSLSGKQWLLGGVVTLILLGLSYKAGSMGLAYLEVLRVEQAIKQWNQQRKAPSESDWRRAEQSINRALELHPDRPYQLTLKARVMEWRGLRQLADGESPEASFRESLMLHYRAIERRPIWPESWSEAALIKMRLGELDDELRHLIEQADRFGPYYPEVHVAAVQAALAMLTQDQEFSTALFKTHLQRGLRDHRTRNKIEAIVRAYRFEAIACFWAEEAEPAIQARFCQ